MKHSTPDGMKFKKLQRRLGLPKYATAGILECLWIATQKNAPRGNIGVYDDESIAIELDWDGEPTALITALVSTGWLDECATHRLVVHDWKDHAPRYVHGVVSRGEGGFVTASPDKHQPDSSELQSATVVDDCSEQLTPDTVDDCIRVQPNLTKPNLTKPESNAVKSPRDGYCEQFEEFWELYPTNAKGRKRGKKKSHSLWLKIPAAERPDVATAARHYATEESEFVKDPERFLHADFWRDYVGEAKPVVAPRGKLTFEDFGL